MSLILNACNQSGLKRIATSTRLGGVRILEHEAATVDTFVEIYRGTIQVKSTFVVNHHVTHLPADGSVDFTDTRGYHTALNGGEYSRIHLVAALP